MPKKKDGKEPTAAVASKKADKRRIYFKQADFPLASLQQAQKIAAAIVDNFGGIAGSPPDVALAAGISPTSSAWGSIAGASIAYGLTEGGVNAAVMKLTPLGKQLVAPEEEGADVAARRDAILKPRILKDFFEKYRRAKFPSDLIGVNVLKTLGLPADRAVSGLEIIKSNGYYAGVIKDTPTGPFVNMDSPVVPLPVATSFGVPSFSGDQEDEIPIMSDVMGRKMEEASGESPVLPSASIVDTKSNRVFISHGKQRAIVEQIKELLKFGNFEPVVSVERESTAISVPEKVFEDMRSCGAGVLHVGSEGTYVDKDGNELVKLNDNVLIEIGAAMALYGKRLILLVEKGVTLPSNLQGLYRCEFEGDKLDYESTMKLLKTFSQFR